MGASSWWGTTNRQPPLASAPKRLKKLMLLWPQLKKSQPDANFFWRNFMWKIAVGFAVFAGLALYVISQGGDNIDMTGEKHGAEAVHVPAPAEAPAAPAAAPASK